ncbi:MAG: hypothetical protein EOO90_04525 [Pedobacter sp.]|nr:MAG: hypothetical protein EOO90_04525 [Pedobacter sp.]
MKHYKKIAYTALTVVAVACQLNSAFAQSRMPEGNINVPMTTNDITFKVWRESAYSQLAGTPYLSNEWGKGILKFGNNSIINGVELKYDQIGDALLFKNSAGETMELSDPILEFKIEVPKKTGAELHLFRAGFKPVGKNDELTRYEVLSDGNVKFLKRTVKTVVEEKEYNSSTTLKKIVDNHYYYVVKPDQAPVQVSKSDIVDAIGDKKSELTAYIKSQKLNLKKESDILKVFEYYFTISKAS